MYLETSCVFQCHFSIIAVGGDGMFSEILNGVLASGEQSSNGNMKSKSTIKLGIIPAGIEHLKKLWFIIILLNILLSRISWNFGRFLIEKKESKYMICNVYDPDEGSC